MDEFQLITVRLVLEDGCAAVAMSGEIDVESAPVLDTALLSAQGPNVVLDVQETSPSLPAGETWLKTANHARGTIGANWPNRRRPRGEHPEKMAEFSGLFDGNPA